MFAAGSHLLTSLSNAPREASEGSDLSSLMIVFPIGSAVPLDTNEKLKIHFPNLLITLNAYGLTESGHSLTMSTTPRIMGSVYMNTELKIVDPATEKVCQENESGEIWARTKWAMKGYLNRPEEEAKFFAGNGWFRTGDLAHYDEELVLHFDGRLRELIKFQNKHIYPNEVSV
jgi:acyl-CoA synthetase (AMP-forming)/AMP-acid ligase II